MLVQDLFCSEDAHAQERSLCPQMLSSVKPGEVWIAERNFCTRSVLLGIDQRQADFSIREHLNLPQQALEPLQQVGVSSTDITGHYRGQTVAIKSAIGMRSAETVQLCYRGIRYNHTR